MRINAFRRYWPVYALAGLYLILGLGTRIVLWSAFGADAAVSAGAVLPILPAGCSATRGSPCTCLRP